MKAIILAAGEGKRLRPITETKPKCLVEINGKSLLNHQISILKSRNIKDIVLIGGYKAHMLEGKAKRLYINSEYKTTNMVYSLLTAIEELDEDVIISYGDIVYSGEILDILINSNKDLSVAVDIAWRNYWESRFVNPLLDAETMRISEEGTILELGKKTNNLLKIEGQYIGLIKLTKKGVGILKENINSLKKIGNLKSAYMTDLIQQIINDGNKVWAARFNYPWIEVDNINDLNSKITSARLKEIVRINIKKIILRKASKNLGIILKNFNFIYLRKIKGYGRLYSYLYIKNYFYYMKFLKRNIPFRHLSTFYWNKFFYTVLENFGITSYLYGGALLGAMRQKGYAGRPADVDYLITVEDALKLKKALKYLKKFKFNINKIKVKKGIININPPAGSRISLVFYKLGKKEFYYRSEVPLIILEDIVNYSIDYIYDFDKKSDSYYFLGAKLNKKEKLNIYGNYFYVPSNYYELVLNQYGEDWKTPK